MKKIIYLLGIGITVLLVQFAYGKLAPEKLVSANVIAENSLEKVFKNSNIHKALRNRGLLLSGRKILWRVGKS